MRASYGVTKVLNRKGRQNLAKPAQRLESCGSYVRVVESLEKQLLKRINKTCYQLPVLYLIDAGLG
jgi:hypothetical protein